MMKFFLIKITLLVGASLVVALIVAQDSSELQSWVGKRALHRINGKTFFQKADELLQLKKTLPRKEHEYLTGDHFLHSLVTQVDSFLVTNRCLSGCCPCENLWLAVKLNTDKYMFLYHIHPDDTLHVIHAYGRGLTVAEFPLSVKEDLICALSIDVEYNDSDKAYPRNRWIDTIRTIQ